MDYEGFKKEILKLTTIDLDSYKEKQMKRRIDSLINKNGYSNYEDYVHVLKSDKVLFNEFINYLTINVSEFYRNPSQWETLENSIFPMLLEKTKTLKIWSCAASTGDEPYTLVMVLNKFLPLDSIKIIATDIDAGALEKAAKGVYTSKSVESLPKTFIDKYFHVQNDMYTIKDEVKRCVQFSKQNLLKDPYPDKCDLIVCRNVLIYFTEEAKTVIYEKFSNSLKQNGVLFVGSTEQILTCNKYSFKPCKSFFYIKE